MTATDTDFRLALAETAYAEAANDVDRALAQLNARSGRIAQQIEDARQGKPIALDEPEWVSQDALKVTVAIARYAEARARYGGALREAGKA